MAIKIGSSNSIIANNKKRPGVHAKSKVSKHKSSKNYRKPYNGQGR